MLHDSVPDVLHVVQPPDLSFHPIRAAIAASLEEDAAELIFDACLMVACLADGNHVALLEALSPTAPDAERVLLLDMAEGMNVYGAEIQAIRAITNTLTAAGLALGFSADVVKQLIIDKKRRELLALPSAPG